MHIGSGYYADQHTIIDNRETGYLVSYHHTCSIGVDACTENARGPHHCIHPAVIQLPDLLTQLAVADEVY
jgi:hypothetical protein